MADNIFQEAVMKKGKAILLIIVILFLLLSGYNEQTRVPEQIVTRLEEE